MNMQKWVSDIKYQYTPLNILKKIIIHIAWKDLQDHDAKLFDM